LERFQFQWAMDYKFVAKKTDKNRLNADYLYEGCNIMVRTT